MAKRGILMVLFAFLAAAATPPLRAQAFDAISIEPIGNLRPTRDTIGVRLTPGRFHVGFVTVEGLIRYAYDLPYSETDTGGDDWKHLAGKNDEYIVDATFPPTTTEADAKRMLQKFLADRFQLQVHRESQIESYLALTIAEGGPKNLRLEPATVRPREGSWGGCLASAPGCAPVNMNSFAASLSLLTRTKVIDQTGLASAYYITLWCNETVARFDSQEEADAAVAPSIYTALPEQLGLRLTPAKGPIEALFIDRIAPLAK